MPHPNQLKSIGSKAYIEALKDECDPKCNDLEWIDKEKRCNVIAPDWTDEWNDVNRGYKCWRTKGHSGEHVTSDGANGWHRWDGFTRYMKLLDSEPLKYEPKYLIELINNQPIKNNKTNLIKRFFKFIFRL